MIVSRRRFLAISAAFAMTPRRGAAETWRGRAFGAEVTLTVRGPRDQTGPVVEKARKLLQEVEQLFSLYDPQSDLNQLNRTGRLAPSPLFHRLMLAADAAHRQTQGLFDPTVQPLWHALAKGQDPNTASQSVGWNRVRFDLQQITLGAGQKLTFNGIAQGFATDLVTAMLQREGLRDVLVNIGEYRALGGPWTLGLEDPNHGYFGTRILTNRAIATSSPQATPLGKTGHIIHPRAVPQWSTVSVEASTATVADSLSTALALAPLELIERLRAQKNVHRITLVDHSGDLVTL